MRALVIGAGPTTSHEHLPVLAKLRDIGEIILALVCDIDRDRAAAARHKFGFLEQGGDGMAALLRTDIDVVYIFGSAQLHFEYGLLALQSGKHLFVEKPIAPSYAQAVVLAHAAKSRGLIAAGGLNRRFFKSLSEIRERGGNTGWRFAEAVFHKPEFGNPPPFGAATWLSANGIHALDALLFMMGGPPERVSALSETKAARTPAAFSAIMQWPDGAQGVFACNNAAGSRRETYVFHGHGETWSVDGAGVTVEKNNTSASNPQPSIGDGFAAEHAAFLQAVRTGAEPLHSIAAIAPSLFLAELIEAGFSGRVELPRVASLDTQSPAHQAADSILIAQSSELQRGLTRLIPKYRLVSLEDLCVCAEKRPDVVAAILGRGSSPLTNDILDKVPSLRVVGIMALSLARHDPDALLTRGITIVNASAAYANSVAEFALGLAILARRRAFASDAVMRAGGWGTDRGILGVKGLLHRTARCARPAVTTLGLDAFTLKLWRKTPIARTRATTASLTPARDLQGAMVGLIGWGENARIFANHLIRLGARVLVYSEHARAENICEAGAAPASLGEVLAADIVSLHRGLTARTRHFLGTNELAKLRPGAVLINIARSALIEPNALIARLRHGDMFACLDTFDVEPLAPDHPLRKLPNVFLTSHIAGGSKDMHAEAADEIIRKVETYLNGDPVQSVSEERLKSMT
jgi:phosphoglycerate dehydrogenase-like enzyme/predicted dehydrogenase